MIDFAFDFSNENEDDFEGNQENVSFVTKQITIPEWLDKAIDEINCRYNDNSIKYSSLLALGLEHKDEIELFSGK